jgi:glycosyltransferase involved in cell wall biosynthesis
MSSRIVILVPAYRCEATITATLQSIQEQGPALGRIREVILVDDGSRDRIAEIARSVWQTGTPLRICEREFNCGEYASVNSAVGEFSSDTEWFLIMHGDNIAKPGWLKTLLDYVEEAPESVGSICSSYDCFSDNGNTVPGENEEGTRVVTVNGTADAVSNTLERGCWWHISSCAIRVSAYRQVGGLPKIMQLKGDWDFLLRVLAGGWSIEYIPKTLMLYRENPAGSSSLSFRRHMDIWETMLVVGRFHRALSASALLHIHARHIWYVARRLVRAVIRLDIIRGLWAIPAFGCVLASYCTCVLDGAQEKSAQRRQL